MKIWVLFLIAYLKTRNRRLYAYSFKEQIHRGGGYIRAFSGCLGCVWRPRLGSKAGSTGHEWDLANCGGLPDVARLGLAVVGGLRAGWSDGQSFCCLLLRGCAALFRVALLAGAGRAALAGADYAAGGIIPDGRLGWDHCRGGEEAGERVKLAEGIIPNLTAELLRLFRSDVHYYEEWSRIATRATGSTRLASYRYLGDKVDTTGVVSLPRRQGRHDWRRIATPATGSTRLTSYRYLGDKVDTTGVVSLPERQGRHDWRRVATWATEKRKSGLRGTGYIVLN